jgi:hypothetical protein
MSGRRLIPALCAIAFFWILALHVATGILDFIVKDGFGSKSGAVALINSAIDGTLVVPLGRPVATGVLFALGIAAGWIVRRAALRNAAA